MERFRNTNSRMVVSRAGPIIAIVIVAALAMGISPAGAAIMQVNAQSGPFTPSTTTDEVAFASYVSSTDLLTGIVGTGGTWLTNGSSPAGLNDGLNGGDYDAMGLPALAGAAWSKDGDNVSFREFALGAGPNSLGYDITEIQSIAAWQGAGFQNQKYDILVKYLGDTTFTQLYQVNYQPSTSTAASNAQGGATKVNVTDSSGLLASGVVAIKFSFLDTVSNNGGGAVIREIDVFGAPTPEPATIGLLALGGLGILRRRVTAGRR